MAELEIIDIRNQLYRRRKPRSRNPNIIKGVVIHHDAAKPPSKKGNKHIVERLQNYAHMHAAEFNASGIGYHYVIAPDGAVYKCNGIGEITSHAGGVNSETIGIMLMGNFHVNHDTPTDSQLNSLKLLLSNILSKTPSIRFVIPHREVRHRTDCPGQFFTNALIPYYRSK